MAIDESEVRQVANEEIKRLCDAAGIEPDKYRTTVMRSAQQPRIWLVFWDIIKPNKDGLFCGRGTGIDISEDEAVLRERIHREFANEPKYTKIGDPAPVIIL